MFLLMGCSKHTKPEKDSYTIMLGAIKPLSDNSTQAPYLSYDIFKGPDALAGDHFYELYLGSYYTDSETNPHLYGSIHPYPEVDTMRVKLLIDHNIVYDKLINAPDIPDITFPATWNNAIDNTITWNLSSEFNSDIQSFVLRSSENRKGFSLNPSDRSVVIPNRSIGFSTQGLGYELTLDNRYYYPNGKGVEVLWISDIIKTYGYLPNR